MASNLNTLVNQVVAFTGRAWKPRPELRKLVRRLGASVTPRSDVTDQTTVLVRGNCAVWRFGDYGRKELRAAQLLRKGRRIVVVHDFEFRKLVENGRPARASDRISGQPVEWLKAPNVRQFENVAVLSGPLNREIKECRRGVGGNFPVRYARRLSRLRSESLFLESSGYPIY